MRVSGAYMLHTHEVQLRGYGDKGGVKGGNMVVGAEVSVTAGVTIYPNKTSVLELGGKSSSASQPLPLDVVVGEGIAGGITVGEGAYGAAFGVGVGAAISLIASETSVFATNLEDLAKFEDTFNEAQKYAKDTQGTFKAIAKKTGENQISLMFNVTTKDKEGKESTESFTGATFIIDKDKNAIHTSGVKSEE